MLGSYIYKNIEKQINDLHKNISFMEIGSWDGEGIAQLSNLFPECEFYSIDPFIEDGNTMHISMVYAGGKLDHIKQQFKKNTEKCDNLRNYELTTQAFLNKYAEILPRVDILLIDGDHSFLGASTDLLLASMLAKKNDLIVFMDDFNKEPVRKAFNIFADLHGISFEPTDCIDLIKFKLSMS